MSVDAIHALIGLLYLAIWAFIGHVTSRPHIEADSINQRL